MGEQAVALAETMLDRFQDVERGGFYFTADDHESLVARVNETSKDAVKRLQSVIANAGGTLLGSVATGTAASTSYGTAGSTFTMGTHLSRTQRTGAAALSGWWPGAAVRWSGCREPPADRSG